MSQNTPIVRGSQHIVAGDQWQTGFPCYAQSPSNPVSLIGWTAFFSLRQNYGDALPLIALSSVAPTSQGSIVFVNDPVTDITNTPFVTVLGSATAALLNPSIILPGQRQARFFARVWLVDLLGEPVTLWADAWYVEQVV
jgi:hypothetical protein